MKKIKLFGIIALSALLISGVFASSFSAKAEETTVTAPTLALTEFEVLPGEEFATTLYVAENSEICNFQISLAFDPDLVSVISAEESDGSGGDVVVNVVDGEVIVTYSKYDSNTSKQRNIVDFVLKLNEEAGIGSYDLFKESTSVKKKAGRIVGTKIVEVPLELDFSSLYVYGMGDVDLSGEVNIFDVTNLRRHLVELITLTDYQLNFADARYDATINILDATHIQRKCSMYDVQLGNRQNIYFYDKDGNLYATKSVLFGSDLTKTPMVPEVEELTGGRWSATPDSYVEPDLTNIESDLSLYANYSGRITEAMEYYKDILRTQYYSGDMKTGLSGDMSLLSDLMYQEGRYAKLYWTSSNNTTLNATTGKFSQPSYDTPLTLSATIVSYRNGVIDQTDYIDFDYMVKGVFQTPSKAEIKSWLETFFGESKINYDLKLPRKLTNEDINSSNPYEVRLDWTMTGEDGVEVPVTQISRKSTSQLVDLETVVTFNGKPLEDDGKVYFDNITITEITEEEVRNHIIKEISANTPQAITNGTTFWTNDEVYDTVISWKSGNHNIATVENNTISVSSTTIGGTLLPLEVNVKLDRDVKPIDFTLYYTVSVDSTNKTIVRGTNMDPALYDAIYAKLRDTSNFSGTLTTDALKDIAFVYLDLSGYPDITDLAGLSYCTNLRVLNISGLRIKANMNQIATLSKLEALIASDCGLDNLSAGGEAVLKNAVDLKMLDLSNNNFTSLDSVFDPDVMYGKLSEVYLNDNKLTDVSALSRASALSVLTLANNGLTSDDIEQISGFKYLVYLSLAHNEITELDALKNLKNLRELRLQYNNIQDLHSLTNLINMEALYLGHNEITEAALYHLAALKDLKLLYLNDNSIEDISALNSFDAIESINVSNNAIDSLAVLERYGDSLEEVYAENNNIASFSFVAPLKELRVLLLSGNRSVRESSLTNYLAGLTKMEKLTLSDKPISDLSFIDNMSKLIRLEVENCELPAYYVQDSMIITNESTGDKTLQITEYQDNLASLLKCKSTLRMLNISNNNMAYYTDEVLEYMKEVQGITVNVSGMNFAGSLPTSITSLYELSKLTVFYLDNIHKVIDADNLTQLMTSIQYLSMENCGITDMHWLSKFRNLVYVDLANNYISEFDLDSYVSDRSKRSIQYLYLDTLAPKSTFKTSTFHPSGSENVLKELSLAGISIEHMGMLPYMDKLEYLNISNTGITNIQGEQENYYAVQSVERYESLKTVDVTGLQADITALTNMPSLQKVYAVGTPSDLFFYQTNLTALYNLYNSGVTCYLYNKNDVFVPDAVKEGALVLNEIEDFATTIKVAADGIISNNNPYITDVVNDYNIAWTLSNEDNYQMSANHIAVKSYEQMKDEALTVTASIIVYPDSEPVTRDFVVNTDILRASNKYYKFTMADLGEYMSRDNSFTYDVALKEVETEGFDVPVKPVVDDTNYVYESIASDGKVTPYTNVLVFNEDGSYTISSEAPLDSTTTITVEFGHYEGDEFVCDDSVEKHFTISSRTFTVTYVANGGTVYTSTGQPITESKLPEDTEMFKDVTVERLGYIFKGWYTDEAFDELFYDGTNQVLMPGEDITLYAQWEANSFTVNFDANGGTVEPTSKLILCDTAFGELPTPTRDYYTFAGWYTAAEGGTEVTDKTTMATTSDITVYAHWTHNAVSGWVLASSVPEGAEVVDKKYTYNQTLYTTSDSPTMSGWTQYDSTWEWSEYGAWSAWSKTSATKSDYRKVETKTVTDRAGYTNYRYWIYRTADGYGCGTKNYYTGSAHGSCTKYDEINLTYALASKGYSGLYGDYNSSMFSHGYDNLWFFGESTWVPAVTHTEYRYCDRTQIYTYYFTKTEAKESATAVSPSDTITNVQEWVQYREK